LSPDRCSDTLSITREKFDTPLSTENKTKAEHPVLFVILLLTIAISPWPLGSNRDWAWPVITILCSLVTITLLFSWGRWSFSRLEKISIAAFVALSAWMLLQLVSIPGIRGAITIDFFLTQSDLLKTIGYGCFFLALIRLLSHKHRVEVLAYTVVIIGMLEALVGSTQQLVFELPRARGSFPNPNHYAGFLEVALSLAIGLIVAKQGTRTSSPNLLIELITGPRGRLRLIIVIMIIGLVMSRSRMGNLGFLASILITSIVAFAYTRKMSRNTFLLLISIFIVDVAIIGSYFGVERIQERLTNAPADLSSRVELHEYNATVVQDHLWVGSGAGTYELIMPRYRDQFIPRKPTHAESDYFEFLIELGLVGVIPLLVLVGTGLVLQAKLMGNTSSQFVRGIALGCMMGTVSLLIHASVDVNLQIPSNALLFVLLLAIPHALERLNARESQIE
jgi:hypothetical protein